jgi:hypothetical protein
MAAKSRFDFRHCKYSLQPIVLLDLSAAAYLKLLIVLLGMS